MERLERSFFARPAIEVAPELLNKLLVVGESAGRIVEVEAYTSDDEASHSARGVTARNRVMFGPAGHLYVYFTYGMHHCANIVTGDDGDGQAVLLRALVAVWGIEAMRSRRGSSRRGRELPLADGPGKLCQALGIDRSLDGIDLCAPASATAVLDDGTPPPADPIVGPRIGITRATDLARRWLTPPG